LRYETVVITGAANGIGKRIAIDISVSTKLLILIDNDQGVSLEQLAECCRENGATCIALQIDVTSYQELKNGLKFALAGVSKVDIVFAFAGMLLQDAQSIDVGRRIMDVNFFGVANIIDLFIGSNSVNSDLPVPAKIVSAGSIGALVPTHNSGFYSASKSALTKYLDSVRLSTLQSNTEIHDIVLGFVKTRMIHGLKHAEFLAITDSRASTLILKSINKRRKRVHSIPKTRNIPWWISSFIPHTLEIRILESAFRFFNRK
jgi:short-subunit dehydrogenase